MQEIDFDLSRIGSLKRRKMKAEDCISFMPRMIGDVLLALVLLLIVEIVIVMVRRISAVVLKEDYQKVFIYELILCAVLLLFALDVRFGIFAGWEPAIARMIGWALRAVIALASAVILFFCAKVIGGGMINTAGRADHAIVLGLALENGEPVPDLLSRLDAAQAYLMKYPEARLVLTGGNADGTGRTEAAVMRDILAERGVADGRMILEDQAESTKENFRNTARIIDPAVPVVLISSNYHMDRAVRTAKGAGFSFVRRLPASSSFLHYGANVIWEVVLELNEMTLRR